MTGNEKIFLRIEEAAERLSIGRTKAYELVRAGVIPSTHFGRSVRVHVGALEAWASAQAQPTDAGEATRSTEA